VYGTPRELRDAFVASAAELRSLLRPLEDEVDPAQVSDAFFEVLPEIHRQLVVDAEGIERGDPAAESVDEVILAYPGFLAIAVHRIAHRFYELEVPLLPRVLTEWAHERTGIDIHPGASIGHHFFIDHGTGVVIGETAVIGSRVRIYQGVTLGAKSFPLDDNGNPIKGIDRHPIIEDEVTIYSGATILGRVTIGKGAVIGGTVWLTRSVPAGATISQSRPRTERFENGGGI